MTTLRLTSPITGQAAMLVRVARRQTRKPESGWSGATETPAPAPRSAWLEDLRNREQARQARIASWRASRPSPLDDRRPRPTQGQRDRFAYDNRQEAFRAPGNPGALSEAERASVEATKQKYARHAARGSAPAPSTSPTAQASAR